MINLDKLERMYKAATPGERHIYPASCYVTGQAAKDEAFAAALHNAFPALLALARDGELIDALEIYTVNGEPRFAVRGHPAAPEFFESARAAIDAARKGEK